MVFGTMGAEGLPALLKALNDQDAAVRGASIDALSQMGAAAHVAIPELIKALDDPDPDIGRKVNDCANGRRNLRICRRPADQGLRNLEMIHAVGPDIFKR